MFAVPLPFRTGRIHRRAELSEHSHLDLTTSHHNEICHFDRSPLLSKGRSGETRSKVRPLIHPSNHVRGISTPQEPYLNKLASAAPPLCVISFLKAFVNFD